MSKSVKLPLYNEFLKIFIDHEIIDWQAKHFWEKMSFNQYYRAKYYKRLMYTGLRVLVRCEYLEINFDKSSKKVFFYKETSRLNELRDRYQKQRLEAVFSVKKSELLNQIEDKKNNIKFIESLLSDDKTLEKYFIKYKEKLETDIKNIRSNIKLMDNIMKQ